MRQGHDVGGTRQEEPAGLTVPVHREFDGREQVRRFLDFVEDDRTGQVADKADRVAGRRGMGGRIVENEILCARLLSKGLGQSGFPGLAGSIEEDNRGIGHGGLERRFDVPLNHGDIITVSW